MSIPDNFIYFGLFLNNTDRSDLVNLTISDFINIIDKPNLKFYLDHVTLFHRNDNYQIQYKEFMYEILDLMFQRFIGEVYKVTITHYGYNDRVFAFKVELPDGFPCIMSKIYHITVATFNGAEPVEANFIINWKKLDMPIIVTTTLKQVYYEKI